MLGTVNGLCLHALSHMAQNNTVLIAKKKKIDNKIGECARSWLSFPKTS